MIILIAVLMALLLAGCGDNTDTILGGFSGVLIFGIVAWAAYRYISRRGER